MCFNHSGKLLATCSEDKTVKIWQIMEDHISEKQVIEGHKDSVNCVDFNHDGTMLATASADQTASVVHFSPSPFNFSDYQFYHFVLKMVSSDFSPPLVMDFLKYYKAMYSKCPDFLSQLDRWLRCAQQTHLRP